MIRFFMNDCDAADELASRLQIGQCEVPRLYTLLNGAESTVMNAEELRDALFDMVTSSTSTHFTVMDGDGTTFVRVTKGLQG